MNVDIRLKLVRVLWPSGVLNYIECVSAAGGFPGWLTNVPAKARTNQTGYTDAWMPYAKAVAKFLEPYQVRL